MSRWAASKVEPKLRKLSSSMKESHRQNTFCFRAGSCKPTITLHMSMYSDRSPQQLRHWNPHSLSTLGLVDS
ncbi:hypothetical protein E2C01_049646 [Portunus trituberculatus]|uniref:Uncharacterized protein n=1 Tax=Portunus trituberculatus TaxID=210409 RepID=A0A5B7GA11_PORTR|nr:hypothetical protein [Portunus trituberculatus]